MQSTDDSATEGRTQRPLIFCGAFVCVVALLNLLALAIAWRDQSWIAFGIAIIYGPILNGVLAILSMSAFPLLKRMRLTRSLWRHAATSIGAPLAAIAIDYAVIFSMDLHGC